MKNILLFILLLGSFVINAQDTIYHINEDAKVYFTSQKIVIDSVLTPELYYISFEWIGTKYKYAGESKKGVDCSGFVAEIYKNVYGIQLAGGSKDIYTQVKPLEKDELKEGDLVFFKIKRDKISHVGIYLSNNKFVHASVHSGVVVSDLDEPYYKEYFFEGGRIVKND